MRFIYKFILPVSIIIGGIWYINLIKEENASLKEENLRLKESIAFDVSALKVFQQMDGEFIKENLEIRAYHPSKKEGGYKNAFGGYLIPYRSCAVDYTIIPYGSLIYFDGHLWIACDNDQRRTIRGYRIDVCLRTEEEVKEFGVKRTDCWIWLNK